ncbi:MAG: thiamine phosphate synthase [Rikenellaceae bacterium]|nr:thiamine phosphate synthase [Rikenellaceae bacterium]
MMNFHFNTPIAISLPDFFPNSPQAVRAMIEAGAEIIHVRKIYASEEELFTWLDQIDPEFYPHLTLHHHPKVVRRYKIGGIHFRFHEFDKNFDKTGRFYRRSASCHNWAEAKSLTGYADYVFLSPVFDSISKTDHPSRFAEEQLKILLADPDRPKVVALGGVTVENIGKVREMGFEGAAAIGSVWAMKTTDRWISTVP